MPSTIDSESSPASVPTARFSVNSATRFTLNGSDALELHLTEVCKNVLTGLARIIPAHELAGLALGGGYGRGEGGVLKTSAGDLPYNDLEFYVFVCGHTWRSERRYANALHEMSERLSLSAGVELEFKITSQAKLQRSPQSLFFHDLLMGHRWLLGDDRLLAGCEHHRDAGTLPLSEATRLLMNRCSGLLFAREKLEHANFSSDDADFVSRNIAKTELALGDAVLMAFGQYHWSCLERGRRLGALTSTEALPWIEEVRRRHAAGVEFKLHPRRSPHSCHELQEQFGEISSLAGKVWLWLENRRLGCDFQSAAEYALSGINKWPDTGGVRNLLANVRVFGLRAIRLSRPQRHPRERILNALALLLGARAGASPVFEPQIRHELLRPEPAPIISAYRDRWSRAS